MNQRQTIGRFLSQANNSFPVDCETLQNLQDNISIVQILGNIVGDKAILSGCAIEQNENHRTSGYLFLKTNNFPHGEIIFFEGGNISNGVYVKQDTVSITTQGYDFPQAYNIRSLAPGVGIENYNWGDFKVFKTPLLLEQEIEKQSEEIKKLAPPPLGIIEIFAGTNIPAGYALCEGQQLNQADYKELYAVINNTFNNAPDHTGTFLSTNPGYFRLPDLRGRFIVGQSNGDTDYSLGKSGGSKMHALKAEEMPTHSHKFDDYYFPTDFDQKQGMWINIPPLYGSGSSDSNNKFMYYMKHDTETAGGNKPHENRPPYYTLAYIMRVK